MRTKKQMAMGMDSSDSYYVLQQSKRHVAHVMNKKIMSPSQIKRKVDTVKHGRPVSSIMVLADIYHTYVLRRYKRFIDIASQDPDAIRKSKAMKCQKKVELYTRELKQLVGIAEKLKKLQKEASGKKGAKYAATRVKKQSEEATKTCKMYERDIKRIYG